MTLFELFIQHGNPSQTYTDELVGAFYDQVDDGTMFGEAIAEVDDDKRQEIAQLIDDRTSRSLSHQMIGEIITKQLRAYPRKYLQDAYDGMEAEILAYNRAADLAEKADLDNDAAAGDAQGCMP
jgi:hypothetical protein